MSYADSNHRGQEQPGPIRHDSLPAELLEQIQAVYDVIGSYLNMTLEEFEVNFMRDEDPEEDVAHWLGITGVWIDYHERYLEDQTMSDADEQKLLAALIAISTGVDDPAQLGVPAKIGQRLLECYDRFEAELDQAFDEADDAEN